MHLINNINIYKTINYICNKIQKKGSALYNGLKSFQSKNHFIFQRQVIQRWCNIIK